MKILLKPVFFLAVLITFSQAQSDTLKVLAIPVFTNHTGDVEYDWLNEALADMLTTDIAATKKITIVNRLELKKIIAEQELILSGLVSDKNMVEIGEMVGANLIVTGSYTVIGKQVRVDAQIINVEKGIAEGAATVLGNLDEIFYLEKKLALKVLESLSLELSEEDKFVLYQVDTKDPIAITNNYKGIVALDNNDIKAAENFFTRAVQADPFYEQAKTNLESVSIKVEGGGLFSDALSELDSKGNQLNQLKDIVKEFTKSYYVIEIDGQPEIITNSTKPDEVDVKVNFKIDVNLDAIKLYLNRLSKISDGDMNLFYYVIKMHKYDEKKQKLNFKLYKENWDWMKENYFVLYGSVYPLLIEGDAGWFPILKLLQLKSNGNVVENQEIWISRRTKGPTINESDLSSPIIYCGNKKFSNSYTRRYHDRQVPIKISYTFKSIDINKVKMIDIIEFVDPPKY